MKINHNISALNAYRNLAVNNNNVSKNLEKLSSGLRINRAADDAAGLAISEKMRSQIRGLNMAERNALDGISLIQTAEGALSSTHEILQRMRELAVQAANGTNTDVDRTAVQEEIGQLKEEIDRIAKTTEFNTKPLLDGSVEVGKEIVLQVGANENQTVKLAINNMNSTELKIDSLDLTKQDEAEKAITIIDGAINLVSEERSRMGAMQNRLEHTSNNLKYMSENTTAAESRIRDLDMALEMTAYTKNNILIQSAQAMLAQANQLPQGVLQLLK
ncbi:flagellin [Peribacillus sp. Hz7]|uniref:flagellin N-terminal helical domain-containing protein n=1 Tax=Peribacillus sp. Hz7 TaxID=3344873 RepID=UPI0035CB88B3